MMKKARLLSTLAVVALSAVCVAPIAGADEIDYDDFDLWYCLITGSCSSQQGGPNCQGGCLVFTSVLWHSYCEAANSQWGKCICTTWLLGGTVQCTLSGQSCDGIIVTP